MSQKIDLKNLDFNDIGNWPQKAKIVFCSLLALVIMFVGVLSMGRDQAEETVGASRSNRLMAWRVRLQLITVLLMPLWYLASRG